jgi:hypothetical protein
MDEQEELREWGLTEKLPAAFVKTLKYESPEKTRGQKLSKLYPPQNRENLI